MGNFDQEYYHLRYIGQCKKPTTPLKRLNEDTTSRKNGFLANLFKKIEGLEDNLKPQLKLYVLEKNATTWNNTFLNISNNDADIQEQIIIALFGLENILNSQPGGKNAQYLPSEADYQDFLRQTRTNFFQKFKKSFKSNNNKETTKAVEDWIENIKRLQTTFKYLYKTERSHELNNNYVVTIKKLATPTGSVFGFNLLCMIGHDITVSNFFDAKPILDPNSSQAGYVLCDMISRLQAWEKGSYKNYTVEDTKNYIGKIPYVDLIPWLEDKKITIKEGIQQISMYLRGIRPIITIAFSREVTSVGLSNFVHQSGLDSRTNLMDIVGIPQIVSYADTSYLYDGSDVDGPPSGYSTIMIPHFDPGVDKHTKRSSNGARRVIDIVWRITLAIAEISHDIIEKKAIETTREAIVRQIFDVCRKSSTNCPQVLRILYNRLDFVIEDYKVEERKAREEYPESELLEDAIKSYRTKGAKTRTENSETAQGPPNSEARRHQVLILWKKNIKTLHVGYTRAEKAAWMNWAMTRQVNTNFYLSSLSVLSQSKYFFALNRKMCGFFY